MVVAFFLTACGAGELVCEPAAEGDLDPAIDYLGQWFWEPLPSQAEWTLMVEPLEEAGAYRLTFDLETCFSDQREVRLASLGEGALRWEEPLELLGHQRAVASLSLRNEGPELVLRADPPPACREVNARYASFRRTTHWERERLARAKD